MLVTLTRAQLAQLSKYHVEIYPLTGTETAALAIDVRYDGERPHAQVPFTWLVRSLLRCQPEMTGDEQKMFVSISTFFTDLASESRWQYDADEYDLYLEVDTQTLSALLRRAHDACRPVEGQPDSGGVLDDADYVLALEMKTLADVIAMATPVVDSRRTMLALTWGA